MLQPMRTGTAPDVAPRARRARTGGLGGALLGVTALVLAACGGGSSEPQFVFEDTPWRELTLVPLAAFRENRLTSAAEETLPEPVLFNLIRAQVFDPSEEPLISDWNTLIHIAARGEGEWRDGVRYFLAYEVIESPTSGECTVRIHLIEGLPFDPARPPVAIYGGTSRIGDASVEGPPVTGASECIIDATKRAFSALMADARFAPGWSLGPPDHAG
jgi:hypothetical protein